MNRCLVALAVVCAVGATACGGANAASATDTTASKAGVRATDFTTRDLDGKTVRLSDYLGKNVVLLNFSATWCQPCLAEIPHLRNLYATYKPKGLVLMTISEDGPETTGELVAWAKRNQMTFPVLYDEDSSIASIYHPKKTPPLNVLIDKSGSIIWTHEGYNQGDEKELEAHVAKALEGAAAPAAPAAPPVSK